MAKKKAISDFTQDAPKSLAGQPFYKLHLDEEQQNFVETVWNPDIDIVFVDACAGTGKTTLSVGVAKMLVDYGKFDGIVYIMSPYGERKQGYMPGSITEKSSVYFEAFYQALITCNGNPNTDINDETMVNQKNGTGYITCITDTFLRGSNLDNCVVIIDEAQNYTTSQLKKTLTRIGSHTKAIVIGHTLQCDLEDPESSGFAKYIEHYKSYERAAVCPLTTNHRGWISAAADLLEE